MRCCCCGRWVGGWLGGVCCQENIGRHKAAYDAGKAGVKVEAQKEEQDDDEGAAAGGGGGGKKR